MAYKNLLVNGHIPAKQDCPFREKCTYSQQGTCHHTGIKHPVNFSCATARLFELIGKTTSKS